MKISTPSSSPGTSKDLRALLETDSQIQYHSLANKLSFAFEKERSAQYKIESLCDTLEKADQSYFLLVSQTGSDTHLMEVYLRKRNKTLKELNQAKQNHRLAQYELEKTRREIKNFWRSGSPPQEKPIDPQMVLIERMLQHTYNLYEDHVAQALVKQEGAISEKYWNSLKEIQHTFQALSSYQTSLASA